MFEINTNKWLTGTINGTSFCDDSDNHDAVGFFLASRGVDNTLLRNKTDVLELVYSVDVAPELISPLLHKVELPDSDYSGLHWNIRPEVLDIMNVNDAEIGKQFKLSDGAVSTLTNEFERQCLIYKLFNDLGETVIFIS